MGEAYQYHVTMLVCREQEDAIRALFRDNNWTCWLNVLSEQTVADIRAFGYQYIFSDDMKYPDQSIVKSEFIEIKSEVVNVDDELDTDSEIFGSPHGDNAIQKTWGNPLGDNEVPKTSGILGENEVPKTSGIPLGNNNVPKTSEIPVADLEMPVTSGNPTANYKLPMSTAFGTANYMRHKNPIIPTANYQVRTASGIFPVNYMGFKAPTPDVAGVPASGYVSDLVTNDKSKPTGVVGVPASGYVSDWVTNDNSKFTHQLSRFRPIQKSTSSKCNVLDEFDKHIPSTGRIIKKNEDKGDTNKIDKAPVEIQQRKRQSFNYLFCPDCDSKFLTYEQLWKHRDEARHKLPKLRPLGQMKKKFSPEELMKMGFTKCTECSSYFPTQRKLRQHLYASHREIMPPPTCPVCGEDFQSYKELYKHKREKQHNDSLWRLNSYQCDTCGKHFTKYENFKRHKQMSCGKSEAELEALRVHPCEICGKRFTTLRSVKHHMSVVHETDESVCDICGKVCKSKFALRGHKLRHSEKNRKFVCDECGKGFFTSTILKQHKRCHTKEKPFKCPLCEYTCSVPGNIIKHARNVHKQQVLPVNLTDSKQ
ncbi:zinc finger protein 629-like isoform X2 [Mercenaria mercenaria]|uniref:zinc finger protein 629-like isoform X2 n=1 Tax=Mercenaria mercenaria TaxID=6596 RepID=UPI00234E72BF|nr:zinc finger protein 629-like isoform X2 [Mercenaria mercenaria]